MELAKEVTTMPVGEASLSLAHLQRNFLESKIKSALLTRYSTFAGVRPIRVIFQSGTRTMIRTITNRQRRSNIELTNLTTVLRLCPK
jgi:hypothetical protein